MALTPAIVVAPPAPRGLRYGLLTAANGPLELPARAGSGGVTYRPTTCGFARLYSADCTPSPATKTFDPATPYTTGDPFVVYATTTCSAVGRDMADAEAEVRQRLITGEQLVVEEAFSDVLAGAATTVYPGDTDSFREVVGELEQWLYGIDGAKYGPRGYLHAPVRYATLAAYASVLVADGPVFRTQLGTIWSFGGGYPDDGRVWATGNTTLWRAASPNVLPPEPLFNRTSNTLGLIAEREYVVAYDCVAAVAHYTGDTAAS